MITCEHIAIIVKKKLLRQTHKESHISMMFKSSIW